MAHIGIFGDYNPRAETHIATNQSLEIAAHRLGIEVRAEWIPTPAIMRTDLDTFDAFIVNTGVYEDRDAVLHALRNVRERKIPTLAACGGFQHMILEYARNVLGLDDVGHAEFDPKMTDHIIVPLQCSLRGRKGCVSLVRDSQVGQLYQQHETTEKFYCSFGVNPDYLVTLKQSPLRIVGADEEGVVRVTELPEHPFFIGTLFVPQARSLEGESHPLIDELVKLASKR